MIYHVVPAEDWHAEPDRPYTPPSVAAEGFVHCSPDEPTTLAVVNAFYRAASRPLLALVLDETRLAPRLAWEAPTPVPPPGVPEGTLFPHLHGPLNRDAVAHVLTVQWDTSDHATGLTAGD